jgi:hypothetical protein
MTDENEVKHVRLCTIPNVAFARFGSRTLVRLVCPSMWGKENVKFEDRRLKVLYDDGIRPAIETVMDELHGESGQSAYLPPLYDHVAAHNQNPHQYAVRQVPREGLDRFATLLLENLQQKEGFQDAFFYHESMGEKMAYCHNPDDLDERRDKLINGILHPFCEDKLPRNTRIAPTWTKEKWYVDVALEFSSPTHVIHWQRDGHMEVLATAFEGSDENALSEIIEAYDIQDEHPTRGPYRVDNAVSLHQVAGLFFDATHSRSRRAVGESRAISAIAYCTDKSLFIKRGSESTGPYSTPSCRSVSNQDVFDKKIVEHVNTIMKLLRRATYPGEVTRSSNSRPQSGAARLEIRIPVQFAENALYHVSDDFRRNTLFACPSMDWW